MQELNVVSAVVALVNAMSGWNVVAVLLAMFVLPPLFLSLSLFRLARAMIDLRDEVRTQNRDSQSRYDDNVYLVKEYETMSKELTTMVRLNTAANTRLADLIEHLLGRA
ncbi:hypothetical protein [Desulfofustis limnaeus]|uniref:Uncharacterized protein n=1 Tax=Desulfofustis limnaeus TaxID=2740163 RepID=A0ABM7WD64_9BACT|nr:hypothetical protein [Desulfofustis limnaeus]BDD88882.1 hypothetical protein DPPLL_32470 [Desulfofustis limnaeus]